MTEANPIRNVSDTALWVAVYRAMESERADALFHDPFARRLGGARGQAIVDALPNGAQTAWPLVVRTVVMDDIVQRCVAQGVRTVLNLAAGLDARPYRLPLPADLRWLHVDMPVIAHLQVHDNSVDAARGKPVPDPLLVLEMIDGNVAYPVNARDLVRTPEWAKPLVEAALELSESRARPRKPAKRSK